MIKALTISRFKSIERLDLPCRKVNVFIGAPDTGKTNILEALYFLCQLGWALPIGTSLRLRQDVGFEAVFYRQFIDRKIQVVVKCSHPFQYPELVVSIDLTDRNLHVALAPVGRAAGLGFNHLAHFPELAPIRYYIYSSSEQWGYVTSGTFGGHTVGMPSGGNLLYIARHNENVNSFLKEMVGGLNRRLKFDGTTQTLRIVEIREQEIVDYNLDVLSDSVKRLFFYSAIISSTKQAVIVLDEPDVFAFPPYPRTLAEMIASDDSNQFFVTTHNPYFLESLVQKTLTDQLGLFVCYRSTEGSTLARLLNPDEVARVIEY